MDNLEALKYPIGRFNPPAEITPAYIKECIERIEALPAKLRKALAELPESQLDEPYRPGGWTVRQLVHHIADSHINSYIRFKWTLTENSPTIKAYEEKDWAEIAEAKTAPIEVSLDLLDALHRRWVLMLKNLTEEDCEKYYIHPDHGKAVTLAKNIALYAWHGDHHLAQIPGTFK